MEECTFSFNGRPYDFHKVMGLPVLAQRKKRKQKTMPFGVYLLKSQVLHRAALGQYLAQRLKAAIPAVSSECYLTQKLQELLPLGAGPGTGQPGIILGFSLNRRRKA